MDVVKNKTIYIPYIKKRETGERYFVIGKSTEEKNIITHQPEKEFCSLLRDVSVGHNKCQTTLGMISVCKIIALYY